jgi:hypothetical protein
VVARRRAPAWPRLRCSAGRADLAWSRAQGAEKEQRRGLPEAVTARGGGGRARLRLGIPETAFGGGTRRRGRRPWRGALLRSGTKRKREPAKEKIKATYGMHMILSVQRSCAASFLAKRPLPFFPGQKHGTHAFSLSPYHDRAATACSSPEPTSACSPSPARFVPRETPPGPNRTFVP